MTASYFPHRDSSKNILLAALGFSILVHLLFFTTLPLHIFSPSSTDSISPTQKVIRVKKIPMKDGQIVDLQDEKSVVKDTVDTDYLSDKNRRVEQQTRSLNVTRQQNQSTTTPESSMRQEDKVSKYKLDLSDKTLQKLAQKSGQPILNQSMTSNYLPEITIGNETLLNTKEFAFHTFYIRMKREIEGFWHPDRTLATSQIFQGTYITTITVILDDSGYLLQANVIKGSGIPALDLEAKTAIERASPFPNPPKELLSEDQKIRVNWNFIFDRTGLM